MEQHHRDVEAEGGIPPQVSIDDVGDDDQGAVVETSELWDAWRWEEDVVERMKDLQLLTEDDRIVPHEFVAQGSGIEREGEDHQGREASRDHPTARPPGRGALFRPVRRHMRSLPVGVSA